MRAEIVRMDKDKPDKGALKRAGALIKSGALVAFPTETVYGLGGNALDSSAAEKIYAAKGRPSDNPLIVHIARMEDLEKIAVDIPSAAYDVANKYWPGPLTMIFKKSGAVPLEVTGGLGTVAVRFPSHPVAHEFIIAAGGFIAAPSANLSGRPSPTKAEHVIEDLGERIDMIIDSGEVDIGLESTIVDFTEAVPTILRPGYISYDDIKAVTGEARIDRGLISEDSAVRPKAPGMKYRHYAPKGELIIVEGEKEAVAEKINALISEKTQTGVKCAVLCCDETKGLYKCDTVLDLGSIDDEDAIAKHLFDCLRYLDETGAGFICSEAFDTARIGAAIMNRLLKAAGHKVIKV